MLIISTIIMLGNGLFMLFKWVIRIIWLIIRQIIKLISGFCYFFGNSFRKLLKNSVEKLYNRLAGKLRTIKNSIIKLISKWKKGSIGRVAEVSDNEKRNIAKLQTDYVLQHEESQISVARRKKLLYRRLTVFLFLLRLLRI